MRYEGTSENFRWIVSQGGYVRKVWSVQTKYGNFACAGLRENEVEFYRRSTLRFADTLLQMKEYTSQRRSWINVPMYNT